MNGNQTAVLAFAYMMEARNAKGVAQPNDMVISTIVTTEMINEVAKFYKVGCYNVLTGFKWIAEKIKELEGKENYVIGGEESFGLMIGDQIRDKDAVSAVALMCEMAAYEKNKGPLALSHQRTGSIGRRGQRWYPRPRMPTDGRLPVQAAAAS